MFTRRAEGWAADSTEKRGNYEIVTKPELRQATRTRKTFALLSSCFFVLSFIFLILVEVGNIADRPVIRDTWFIRLNLTNVIPDSVDNSAMINDVARELGLHDFYQTGLWNFCEGYFNGTGITRCSNPKVLYWFNPVRIVENQLLDGASLTLPTQLDSILDLVKGASNWIFGLYLAGTCLTFLLIFLAPLSLYSKLNAFFLTIVSSLNAIVILAATTLATAMYIILKQVFVHNGEVNIKAEVGTMMFAFMWVAAVFAGFGFVIQLFMMCCCASRQEVRTGRTRSH